MIIENKKQEKEIETIEKKLSGIQPKPKTELEKKIAVDRINKVKQQTKSVTFNTIKKDDTTVVKERTQTSFSKNTVVKTEKSVVKTEKPVVKTEKPVVKTEKPTEEKVKNIEENIDNIDDDDEEDIQDKRDRILSSIVPASVLLMTILICMLIINSDDIQALNIANLVRVDKVEKVTGTDIVANNDDDKETEENIEEDKFKPKTIAEAEEEKQVAKEEKQENKVEEKPVKPNVATPNKNEITQKNEEVVPNKEDRTIADESKTDEKEVTDEKELSKPTNKAEALLEIQKEARRIYKLHEMDIDLTESKFIRLYTDYIKEGYNSTQAYQIIHKNYEAIDDIEEVNPGEEVEEPEEVEVVPQLTEEQLYDLQQQMILEQQQQMIPQ